MSQTITNESFDGIILNMHDMSSKKVKSTNREAYSVTLPGSLSANPAFRIPSIATISVLRDNEPALHHQESSAQDAENFVPEP
jgi:hypothetical protein